MHNQVIKIPNYFMISINDRKFINNWIDVIFRIEYSNEISVNKNTGVFNTIVIFFNFCKNLVVGHSSKISSFILFTFSFYVLCSKLKFKNHHTNRKWKNQHTPKWQQRSKYHVLSGFWSIITYTNTPKRKLQGIRSGRRKHIASNF